MAHTYATVFVHVVFSTKERAALIPADKLEPMWAYVMGIARNHGISPVAIGGTSNHLHALVQLPSTMSLSDAANKLKSNSSRWMSEHGPRFAWQEGYGAFSVSPSQVESVKGYIATQAEHHKKRNFEEEYVALLRKCGVDYDPKHVYG
jgi:putative transposase